MCSFSHLQIKCYPIDRAAEKVFPDTLERTFPNVFRFIFHSYVYYKDILLVDFQNSFDINPSAVCRNLTSYTLKAKTLNLNVVQAVFKHLNLDFKKFCVLVEQFQDATYCNSVTFTDNTVIFFNAFEQSFGEKCRNKK